MRICLSLKKTVQTFANTKQWITKSIKSLMAERNKAFHAGELERKHDLQKQIKCEIRRAKYKYKEKVKGDLRGNRLGSAWESMHTKTGSKTKSNAPLKLVGYKSDIQLAQEFNTCYTRFDVEDFTSETNELRNTTMCNTECNFFNQQDVINVFKKSKVGKSSGPDKIGGRLLKTCADQLGPVFYNIFQKLLYLQKMCKLWKEAIVVPVRKTSYPKTLNDFRPVALTSLVMKCFEKFVRD